MAVNYGVEVWGPLGGLQQDACSVLATFVTLEITRRSRHVCLCRSCQPQSRRGLSTVAQAKKEYDYDLVIIGCGVGGHGAALHAVECVRYLHLTTLQSSALLCEE